MEHLTNIQITRQRAKYNEVLRKKLKEAGIHFAEVSTKYGKKILVNETDYSNASKILLSISLDQATEVYLVSFVSCDKGKCKGKTGYIYTQRVK